jgi:shikimate dehydrogenase
MNSKPKNLNPKSKLLAVIGYPITHSKSPLIFNSAFVKKKLNYKYLSVQTEYVTDAINEMRGGKYVGYSVTIPHKVNVIPLIDEVTPLAKKIGAVNTVVNKNGKLIGYNTDCEGAINAVKKRLKLKGKIVYVLGAGGASRAIIVGLLEEGAKVKIFNRTIEHAETLAKEFGCEYAGLTEIDSKCNLLVNTTSVGMYPNVNEIPVSEKVLQKKMIVFDIVYNPLETMLLKKAKKKGCKIIPGYEMFLEQAYLQFKLFTGKNSPKEIMKKVLLKELKKKE